MNIQVLNKLFDVADDLNDDLIYGDFCKTLVPKEKWYSGDGVLCHNCRFYKLTGDHDGWCMLGKALDILDDAKSVYKKLKNN
jgi:hypothetical protein